MKTSYLNYIDQIEKIVASIKNIDIDEEIFDLYSQLSSPNTKSQAITILQNIEKKIISAKSSKEKLNSINEILKQFTTDITNDKNFDNVNKIIATEPDDEDDDETDDDQEEEKTKSQKSDIDDIFDDSTSKIEEQIENSDF